MVSQAYPTELHVFPDTMFETPLHHKHRILIFHDYPDNKLQIRLQRDYGTLSPQNKKALPAERILTAISMFGLVTDKARRQLDDVNIRIRGKSYVPEVKAPGEPPAPRLDIIPVPDPPAPYVPEDAIQPAADEERIQVRGRVLSRVKPKLRSSRTA